MMEALIALFVVLLVIFVLRALTPSKLQTDVEALTKRIDRLEKQLRSMHFDPKPVATNIVEPPTDRPAVEAAPHVTDQPPISEPAPQAPPQIISAAQADKTSDSPPHPKPIDADALERYVGQRVIGWAAVALAIFAIGFFIKYAYDKGWIIPEGRVAIGEVIGLGLLAAGWWQHRKGNALGSQMLLGCGIAACYLATYAAFGFYELISQPTAGICMTVVMFAAGCLAVVTNAFSLGLLTVLGGLLTPLMLHTGQDQHVSLFTYLTLLLASIYLLYFWKPWPALRSLVWVGAMIQFGLWNVSYYSTEARSPCLVFLALIWLIPSVQILLRGRRLPTQQEDWLLFLITPIIVFSIVAQLLLPDMAPLRGKIAIALTLLYGAISYCTWKWRQHDYHQFQLPLALALICLSVAIPLELDVGWIGIGWVTQGVLLWGAGLWRSERLVRFFGIGTLLLGTLRIFTHDVYLHQPLSAIPFLHTQAIAGLWLSLCWSAAAWLCFHFVKQLADGKRIAVTLSLIAFYIFWIVVSFEFYPYFKSWHMTNRWIGVVWMLMAIPFFWQGCRLPLVEWRVSAILTMSWAVLRSLVNDLPFIRTGEFVPLLNQLSLPVLLTAVLLLALRPLLIQYESIFMTDEKHIKPISGLAALAMILLILSLDTYQFCVVHYPTQELLPHAVLSVVWSLYGAMLLSIGFWKKLATLRWSAIGIFGLTLGKVLLVDLSWLAGLYRILALLLIALVLAGVTWTYQRRK